MQGFRISAAGRVLPVILAMAASQARADDFACHVKLANEESAFVLIQTNSRDAARSIAAAAQARGADGKKQPVLTVVECILRNSERFVEADVQKRFLDRGL